MPSTHTITTAAITASERGALNGHEATCTCGFRATTSLSEREARNIGHQHVAWAARAGK